MADRTPDGSLVLRDGDSPRATSGVGGFVVFQGLASVVRAAFSRSPQTFIAHHRALWLRERS